MRYILTNVCLFFIAFYRVALSPFLGRNCRFSPTCSAYAAIVIKRYGPVRGGALAVKRVLKCHPFHPGGDDPPP